MNVMKSVTTALFMLTALLLAPPVQAQFAGDIFFSTPSVAIAEGGTGTLEVQAFTGASTFGASQFRLSYDPARVEIVAVEAGAATAVQEGFTVQQSPGEVAIIALNSESLSQPIGTVSLARLQVRPLVGAGSVININTAVDQVLRQDSSAFTGSDGFGVEVVVTAAGGNTPLAAPQTTQVVAAGSALHERALAVRPAGSHVTLMVLDENNQATAVNVQTFDATASEVD